MKLILTFNNWLFENAIARPQKRLHELDINRKFSKDQFTGDKYETELFPMFRRLKPRIEALAKKPNLEEWFAMMQNSDNQFYSMVQAGVLGQPDVRELWRDLTGRRASKMHKYNLAEGSSHINELFDNFNLAYPWKNIKPTGGLIKYQFVAKDSVLYEVKFESQGGGTFERSYYPKDSNEIRSKLLTNLHVYLRIVLTTTQITLDFLKSNTEWKELVIHPISAARYKTQLDALTKLIPDEYTIDTDNGVIKIERKIPGYE